MSTRWILLIGVGALVLATWVAAAIAYFFFEPSVVLWTALVTAAALSLEALFWVAAGVFGWSFLARRREMLARLKQRFFGG